MKSESHARVGDIGASLSAQRDATHVGEENDPGEVGVDPAGIERAVELVRGRGALAQLFVVRDGRVIVDRSFGCGPDALFWTFSAGKPYLAVLIHVLAERGLIELDAPVADYWPEFGGQGKDGITVRHVLTHRSGLATAGSTLGDALAMTDWARSVRRIERAAPRWRPGAVPAYQILIYGFILGELAQRVTDTPLPELLRTQLLAPLGSRDTHLGLTDDLLPRAVPVVGSGTVAPIAVRSVNRPATRRAVVPSAGLSTTARDLAAFYSMLLNRGVAHDGTRILQPETIAAAIAPTSDGEVDRYARAPIRWTAGFQLGGPRTIPGKPTSMGLLSTPRTFGHNGSDCCIGWADPDRRLVYAYLTNRVGGRADLAHHIAVADALLTATSNSDA